MAHSALTSAALACADVFILFIILYRYPGEGSWSSQLRASCTSAAGPRSISVDEHPQNDKTAIDVSADSVAVCFRRGTHSIFCYRSGGSSAATSDSASSSAIRTDWAAFALFDPAFAGGRFCCSKEIPSRCAATGSATSGRYLQHAAFAVWAANETQDALQAVAGRYYIHPRLNAAPQHSRRIPDELWPRCCCPSGGEADSFQTID